MKNKKIYRAAVLVMLTGLVTGCQSQEKTVDETQVQVEREQEVQFETMAEQTEEAISTTVMEESEEPTSEILETTAANTDMEDTQEADYTVFTDIPSAEVQTFAETIQHNVGEQNWSALSEMISYPITIGDVTFDSAERFASYDIDSLLGDDFYQAVADTDCSNLFANYQGAMFGNGEIWFAQLLDDNMNSLGLKIIGIHNLGETAGD